MKLARVPVHPAHIEKLPDGTEIEGSLDIESPRFAGHRITSIRAMTKKERKEQISSARSGTFPVIIEVEGEGCIACFMCDVWEPKELETE